ncbi:MAG: oligosaccharide flippase family protein [Calditrichaeota bacterium]|nr:oligosaccharide flippase family protein [Calditrichota bacterium]
MAQKLTKIIGITFLVQIGVFGLGLLNNVLLSRWLGPANLGIIALFFLFTEAIHKVTNLGIETANLYYISNQKFPRKKLIGTNFINGLLTLCLGSGLIILFIQTHGLTLFFEPQEATILARGAYWSILLLFAYMTFDYGTKMLLGHQQFYRYNKIMLARPVLFFILLSASYFQNKLDVAHVLAIYSISWLLPGFYMWWQQIPFPLVWDREITFASVRYGTKIMLSNLLTFLNYRVDIFLVGYFLTKEMVGWYYVALIVSEKLLYLTQSTSTIFFPAASQSTQQQSKTPIISRTNLMLVALGSLVLGILAPWGLPLVFSDKYLNSVPPLLWLLPGVVALTLPKVLSADFYARGRPELSLYTGLVNFVLNVILNIFLIPRWGIVGAAISSSVGYLVAAALMAFYYRNMTGVPFREFIIPKAGDWERLKEI